MFLDRKIKVSKKPAEDGTKRKTVSKGRVINNRTLMVYMYMPSSRLFFMLH